MAKYRIKRKTFGAVQSTLNGVGDAVKTTAGGIMEGVGNAVNTGVGKTAAGVLGAVKGFQMGGIGGAAIGYFAGRGLAKGGGTALKNMGQDLQM